MKEGCGSAEVWGWCSWSQDGCSGWHAPHRQWWRCRCLIHVGGSGVNLKTSWLGDALHVVRKTGGTSRVYQGIFRIVNRNRMELVDQSFELLVFLLGVIVLELDRLGFDMRRRVFARTAALLQSTQFFVLLPTPSTRRTSHTNHTDPSEHTPTNNTAIDTSQSVHTHATHYLQPGNTSDPDHVAYSHAPPFLHRTLHRACTNDHRSRLRKRWR